MKRSLLFCLLLLVASSCISERQRALNKATRYTNKVLAIYAQYPDLVDSSSVTTIDSTRTPARRQSGEWERPIDTTSFDKKLDEYARLASPCPETPVRESPEVLPPQSKSVPPGLSAGEVARREKILRQLREQLRTGAYRDSTYSFSDKYLSITFSLKPGKVDWDYELKPQAQAFFKKTSKLAPKPALPEECQPKRFWNDWLFWLLLLVGVLVRLFWRAFWAYITALVPRPR